MVRRSCATFAGLGGAQGARDEWRKFTEIHGNPRGGAAREPCGDFLPVIGTVEVLFVKVTVFILLLELLFATLPECSQNQTAVSDLLRLLSDF